MASPANPSQLFLLSDHVKLSLLERQRALSLNLEPNAQDGQISRSLDQLRAGIESLRSTTGDADKTSSEQIRALQSQYDDLTAQFHGFSAKIDTDVPFRNSISQPNEPSLSPDFTAAQQLRPSLRATTTSSLKSPSSNTTNIINGKYHNNASNIEASTPTPVSKSVRFTDSPPSTNIYTNNNRIDTEAENRAKLFPYRDDYSDNGNGDGDINNGNSVKPPQLSNDQLHTYHSRVIADQDAQLDQLGASIGRQRELSIRIGDELDEHVDLLEEVDGHVDRQTAQLDRARTRLARFARSAGENKSMTVIVVLIVVLVLLIMITK